MIYKNTAFYKSLIELKRNYPDILSGIPGSEPDPYFKEYEPAVVNAYAKANSWNDFNEKLAGMKSVNDRTRVESIAPIQGTSEMIWQSSVRWKTDAECIAEGIPTLSELKAKSGYVSSNDKAKYVVTHLQDRDSYNKSRTVVDGQSIRLESARDLFFKRPYKVEERLKRTTKENSMCCRCNDSRPSLKAEDYVSSDDNRFLICQDDLYIRIKNIQSIKVIKGYDEKWRIVVNTSALLSNTIIVEIFDNKQDAVALMKDMLSEFDFEQ